MTASTKYPWLGDPVAPLPEWARDPGVKSLAEPGQAKRGDRGQQVLRLQELLTLRGSPVQVDGVFGPATEAALLARTGSRVLAPENLATLVWPIIEAADPFAVTHQITPSFRETVVAVARHHLSFHPKEVGGQNHGPWVRLYMHGHDGPEWPWCGGFSRFILRQAGHRLERLSPVEGSFSCDLLAVEARASGRLLLEPVSGWARDQLEKVRPGDLFLVRRVLGDWVHTGIVLEVDREAGVFVSAEGNTDTRGSREDHEATVRTRAFPGKDFVLLEDGH